MRSLLLPTLLALLPVSHALNFVGKGEVRTVWQNEPHNDLGCLTDIGKWTADDDKCGSFLAVDVGNQLFNLSSTAGDCYVYGAEFICNGGQPAYQFAEWPKEWPNGIENVPVLRMGLYGLMASNKKDAPARGDAPWEVHFTSYSEPSKRFWLTWKRFE